MIWGRPPSCHFVRRAMQQLSCTLNDESVDESCLCDDCKLHSRTNGQQLTDGKSSGTQLTMGEEKIDQSVKRKTCRLNEPDQKDNDLTSKHNSEDSMI
ncbi:hypothetical protein M514_09737, partial [Trichuris suis]|uniref:Uncharacterized protein n=1 Tax=Trichuris suis TaxID=68888 RepID=A0A085LWM8_9BILA